MCVCVCVCVCVGGGGGGGALTLGHLALCQSHELYKARSSQITLVIRL